MSNTIQQNLNRLTNARTNIAEAISDKGVTVPSLSGFEDFPSLIDSISTGGTLNIGTVTNVSSDVSLSSNVLYYSDDMFMGYVNYINDVAPHYWYVMSSGYMRLFTISGIDNTKINTIGINATLSNYQYSWTFSCFGNTFVQSTSDITYGNYNRFVAIRRNIDNIDIYLVGASSISGSFNYIKGYVMFYGFHL